MVRAPTPTKLGDSQNVARMAEKTFRNPFAASERLPPYSYSQSTIAYCVPG